MAYFRTPILIAALALLPVGVQAQTPTPERPCAATAAPLPPELAGWQHRSPMTAASNVGGLGAAGISPGAGVDLSLPATPDIAYAIRSEHPGGSVSHGGMVGFAVTVAGMYRVAIGSAAWIDLVRDGQIVESSAHAMGPHCSGIHKMVDFSLTPGRYVLQIAGNGASQLPLLVTRLP